MEKGAQFFPGRRKHSFSLYSGLCDLGEMHPMLLPYLRLCLRKVYKGLPKLASNTVMHNVGSASSEMQMLGWFVVAYRTELSLLAAATFSVFR